MEAIEAFVVWAVTWLPWLMLLLAVGFVGFGWAALGDEGNTARDFLLLAIAVTMLMIGFVGLVVVQ